MELRVHLPEELLDEIFNHLLSVDRRSLQRCSLVSKVWLELSQRVLFSSIRVDINACNSWLDKIPPTNTGILCYVRSLEYFLHGDGTTYPTKGVYALRDYFPSLSHLRALTFRNVDVEPTIPDNLEIFSPFQHTLSSLSFVQDSISWSAFVALLGYFPRLRHLEIRKLSFQVDGRPAPKIRHALCGRLVVALSGSSGMQPFISRFSGLRPQYEELVMLGLYEHRLAVAVRASLRSLKINQFKGGTTPDLSRFRELRQLEITAMYPREEEHLLISSITSLNFRKLVVVLMPTFNWVPPQPTPHWTLFEEIVCGIADRLRASGSRHTLEVEFHARLREGIGEEHHKTFLPKFKEKGLVRIVSIISGAVREWP